MRRLLTGLILLTCIKYPFLQCSLLLVFSVINFIYVYAIHPLATVRENRIETFNEFCIMMCAHLYDILLRGEGSPLFINCVGWTFIGMSVINIAINLVLVLYDTVKEAFEKCARKI